jgi:hypothetical protein
MSLNKFTDDSVRQEWANIGCNRLNCNTLTADNIDVPLGEFEQLLVDDVNTPQILVSNGVLDTDDVIVETRSFNSILQFQDQSTNGTGYMISNDTGFFIDAEDKESVKIDSGIQFKTSSEPSVPDGSSTTLYGKIDGDFAVKTIENVPYTIGNARFVQTQPQDIPGGVADSYVDILESVSLGIGSLQIKEAEQIISVYELKFSGKYNMDGLPRTLRFSLWENGIISQVVTRDITLPAGEGDFDGKVYIVFGEAVFGVAANICGNIQFNGLTPGTAEILPIPAVISIGPAIDILYGIRMAWAAGSTPSDSLTTLAGTMNRLY